MALPCPCCWEIVEPPIPQDCSSVVFYKECGELERVEAIQISDQDLICIALETSREERGEILQDLFLNRILPYVRKTCSVEIEEERLVPLDAESGFFALLHLQTDQEKFVEGFLSCFIADRYVLFSRRVPRDLSNEDILNCLLEAYRSFRIEKVF